MTSSSSPDAPSPGSLRVVVIDADPPLLGLLEEWLDDHGCSIEAVPLEGHGQRGECDLVVVDVPFPRQGGMDVLRRIAAERPGIPVIALSSNFFPGVELDGAVARGLGVAGVLSKPVRRDALVAAVRKLLRERAGTR